MSDSNVVTNPAGGANDRQREAQPALHEAPMEAVLAPQNLRRAWRRVKSNKGAPGSDGMPVEDFAAYARCHWPRIRQALLDGSSQPQPVRRVMIPKWRRATPTRDSERVGSIDPTSHRADPHPDLRSAV